MKKRILFDFILFALAFYAPWWVTLVFVAIGVFKFPFYSEAILFGVLLDLLYGTTTAYGFGAVSLALAFVIFIITLRVKSAVRPA